MQNNTQSDNNQHQENIERISAAYLNTTQWGSGGMINPTANAIALQEIAKHIDIEPAKQWLRRLWKPDRAMRKEVETILGVTLPLENHKLAAMMDEVRRYQWIEAERAGRNIWKERNPFNPEASALREWFRLYFGEWYLANIKMNKATV